MRVKLMFSLQTQTRFINTDSSSVLSESCQRSGVKTYHHLHIYDIFCLGNIKTPYVESHQCCRCLQLVLIWDFCWNLSTFV